MAVELDPLLSPASSSSSEGRCSGLKSEEVLAVLTQSEQQIPPSKPRLPASAVPLPQQSIAKYYGARMDDRKVGSGGCGIVYFVVEPGSVQPKALKLSRVVVADDVHRMLREQQLANTLQHPTIVPIHGAFYDEEEGVIGLLMPLLGMNLMDGVKGLAFDQTRFIFSTARELSTWPYVRLTVPFQEGLKGGRLSESAAMLIFIQLVVILRSLHRAGIKHGDIKLNNLLLDLEARGHISLADFGSAVRLPPTQPPTRPAVEAAAVAPCGEGAGATVVPPTPVASPSDSLVVDPEEQRCAHKGWSTPMYVPPEWFNGVCTSYKQDWYAAGVVLFQLLTELRWPFPLPKNAKDEDVKAAIIANRVVWPERCNNQVSPGVRQLVEGLLQGDPDQRWGLEEVLLSEAMHLRRLDSALEGLPHLRADVLALQEERWALLGQHSSSTPLPAPCCGAELAPAAVAPSSSSCSFAELASFFERASATRQGLAFIRHSNEELAALGIPMPVEAAGGVTGLARGITAVGLALGATSVAYTLTTATAAYAFQILARMVPQWPMSLLHHALPDAGSSGGAGPVCVSSLSRTMSSCALSLHIALSSQSIIMMDMIRMQ